MQKYILVIILILGFLFSMERVAIIDIEVIGVSSDDAKA